MSCRNVEGMQFLHLGKKLKFSGGRKSQMEKQKRVTLGILWSSKNTIRSAAQRPVEQEGLPRAPY